VHALAGMTAPTARMTGAMTLVAMPAERAVRLVTDVSHHEALSPGVGSGHRLRGGMADMPP
jgi:hypothetical protein